MRSDRVFGAVLIILALAYIASAFTIQTSFLTDPVGSKTFPILVGLITALCGATMILRPDDEPDWPDLRTFARLGFSVLVMIAYAFSIAPLGFLIPTAIAAGLLAYQITPHAGGAVTAGLGLSLGLYVVFRYGLGLGLTPFPPALLG